MRDHVKEFQEWNEKYNHDLKYGKPLIFYWWGFLNPNSELIKGSRWFGNCIYKFSGSLFFIFDFYKIIDWSEEGLRTLKIYLFGILIYKQTLALYQYTPGQSVYYKWNKKSSKWDKYDYEKKDSSKKD